MTTEIPVSAGRTLGIGKIRAIEERASGSLAASESLDRPAQRPASLSEMRPVTLLVSFMFFSLDSGLYMFHIRIALPSWLDTLAVGRVAY